MMSFTQKLFEEYPSVDEMSGKEVLLRFHLISNNFREAEYMLKKHVFESHPDFWKIVSKRDMGKLLFSHLQHICYDELDLENSSFLVPSFFEWVQHTVFSDTTISNFKSFNMGDNGVITLRLYIKKFAQIALDNNDGKTMNYLVTTFPKLKEEVNEYMYVIMACGGGVMSIVQTTDVHTLLEIADECIETAYLCDQLDMIKLLVPQFKITNPFLKQKVLEYCCNHDFRPNVCI